MSGDQTFTIAVLTLLSTTLLAAIAGWRQTVQTHQTVNSRMTELLTVSREQATKEGELKGRDFARAEIADANVAPPV